MACQVCMQECNLHPTLTNYGFNKYKCYKYLLMHTLAERILSLKAFMDIEIMANWNFKRIHA